MARIGLDCRGLRSYNSLRGIGSYTRNLVGALLKAGDGMEWVVFGCEEDELRPLVAGRDNARAVIMPAPALDPLRQVWLEWRFARALRVEKVDLLHTLDQNTTPFLSGPSIVTVHDLIPQVMGGAYWGPRARLRMVVQRRAARQATRVITTSRYTAGDVERLWGIDARRIRAVPAGVTPVLGEPGSPAGDADVLRRYGIDRPYLLYVGGFDPRKNIGNLLLGFERAVSRDGKLLVLAGSADAYEESVRSLIAQMGAEGTVKLAGFIRQEDLAPLYRMARGFLFLSLYEGFGLPVLEAMACGTPVVAAHASSLPEVAGDAALLVDPLDPAAIAAAIDRILTDEALAASMRQRGFARAAELSWDATAAKTMEIYDELLH